MTSWLNWLEGNGVGLGIYWGNITKEALFWTKDGKRTRRRPKIISSFMMGRGPKGGTEQVQLAEYCGGLMRRL